MNSSPRSLRKSSGGSAHAVEPVHHSDIGVIAKVHAKCFFDAWSADTIRQVLDMPGAFGLVARRASHDSIIGFALARVAADECELLSLGVLPEFRGQGVATALFQQSMARAMAERARWFFLEVAQDNMIAHQIYQAHGLVRVGSRPDYYENADGSRTSAYTMRCELPVSAD